MDSRKYLEQKCQQLDISSDYTLASRKEMIRSDKVSSSYSVTLVGYGSFSIAVECWQHPLHVVTNRCDTDKHHPKCPYFLMEHSHDYVISHFKESSQTLWSQLRIQAGEQPH